MANTRTKTFVECSSWRKGLTVGNRYEVTGFNGQMWQVMNDTGDAEWYDKTHFKTETFNKKKP
jgi:hypothetical protein